MSSTAYVVTNQQGQFWTRSKQWVDGREPKRLLKLKHHDEAVNLLVELSAKDIELRGFVVAVELAESGEPVVTPSEHKTPTLAEEAKLAAVAASETEQFDVE
ncbi:MAG: hypothetical protein AAGC91_15350 [Pseudomonadota bacterium]